MSIKLNMKRKILTLILTILSISCKTQTQKTMQTINRTPYVAGQFYPASKTELERTLESLFKEAKPSVIDKEKLRAIIVPHAGYIFSGVVAASAFNQIDPSSDYERIFIIGSSHRTYFDGASIYNMGNYETPLGIVPVDIELANDLINKHKEFTYRSDAEAGEHTIEVQLPFLQYKLKKNIPIVPIIIATQNPITCKQIAEHLKPYFNEKNLFIISTDFSHYPSYNDAIKVDKFTYEAILSNSSSKLLTTLKTNDDLGIDNLATSLCGWTSVLTLLYLTENNKSLQYKLIEYRNSGDAKIYSDRSRVVGYCAIAVTQKIQSQQNITNDQASSEFKLDVNDKIKLLKIARNTLNEYVKNGTIYKVKDDEITENIKIPCGAFVSLHKDGQLRGCIGNFSRNIPLYKVVQEMTIASCSKDYRFNPVEPEELKDIEIEISVLTPLKKINSINEIILGKHGIYIVKDGRSGTFLPQVATQTGWTLEEFLGHCARDKAGIGWDGWKNAEIYIYEAIVFSEKEFNLH